MRVIERGPKVLELSAVPAKEILRNKASVCPPVTAITEILDNIFDNDEENGRKDPLHVDIIVETEGEVQHIRILENSGGVRKEKLEPLVRLGFPSHRNGRSIGTWGEGLKIALFSLAREVEIRTHAPGERPIMVHFASGWIDSPDWTVPVYSIKGGAPPSGSTEFVMHNVTRTVDWVEVAREIGIVYGRKMTALQSTGREIMIRVLIDGGSLSVRPRDLLSRESIAERMSYAPAFEPREFHARFQGPRGVVHASIVVGLTARHSGETSGVYLYGNSRLFARALRNKHVGYGDGGMAILRDHPSCWRIHSYVTLSAEHGEDIPWQAPLKDGLSETHPVTEQLRSALREILGSYSRFARLARTSEFLPYTMEWNELDERQKAETFFGKSEEAVDRFRRLPRAYRKFDLPATLPVYEYGSPSCRLLLEELDARAKDARNVLNRRDKDGTMTMEESLAALNPSAFGRKRESSAEHIKEAIVKRARAPKKSNVELAVVHSRLARLRNHFGVDSDEKAVHAAINFALHSVAKSPKKGAR